MSVRRICGGGAGGMAGTLAGTSWRLHFGCLRPRLPSLSLPPSLLHLLPSLDSPLPLHPSLSPFSPFAVSPLGSLPTFPFFSRTYSYRLLGHVVESKVRCVTLLYKPPITVLGMLALSEFQILNKLHLFEELSHIFYYTILENVE